MKIQKRFALPLFILNLIALYFIPTYAQSPTADPAPTKVFLPLVNGGSGADDTLTALFVPNQYIVILQDELVASASVATIASELTAIYGATLLQTYDEAVNGFTLNLPSAAITKTLAALRADMRVEQVEQDQIITVVPLEDSQPDLPQDQVSPSAVEITQPNAPWGLDRIDQRNQPLNSQYSYTKNGAGVKVYIIDSGIRASHVDFEGRVSDGYDTIDGTLPADDCFGHGTHVAATVGGKSYGVAKGVQLVAVRVLDCNGQATISEVIAGVNWVTKERKRAPQSPMVANMSLGGPVSAALDKAVKQSIAAGITYVVAAGNNYGLSACSLSPARVPTAITVGATMALLDFRAFYSNTGRCLDLFAPGSAIPSAWFTSDTALMTLSGTSMAAPHVAGAAALYLQQYPQAKPDAVANALLAQTTLDLVILAGNGSPNRLLFVPQTR